MLGQGKASIASLASLVATDRDTRRRISISDIRERAANRPGSAGRRRAEKRRADRVRPQSAVVSGGARALDPDSTHRTHRLLELKREQEKTKAEIQTSGVGTFHDQVRGHAPDRVPLPHSR